MKRAILAATLALAFVSCVHAQSGNLTASSTTCGTTNSCVVSPTIPNGTGGAVLSLSGSFTATVQFEASGDNGANWVAISATPSNSTTSATSATSAGVWQVNVSGYTNIRLRCSSYMTGTVAATIRFSTASAKGGSGSGAGGSVTSISTTSPITGGPITTTGTIACPTCNTSSATIAGSIASPQVAFGSSANTISGDNTFEFNSTTKAVSLGTPPGTYANEGFFNLFGTFPTGSNCDGGGTHCQDYRVVTGTGMNDCSYLRIMQDSGDATARMNFVAGYEFYCKAPTYSDYSMEVAGAAGLSQIELRNNGFAEIISQGGTGGNMSFLVDSPNSRFDFVGQPVRAPAYTTSTNCADSAGAAACGSAAAGSFVVDAAATTTVVSTTAVTANSEIFVQYDSSLGTRLSVTCNTTVALPSVTARTAGTSFTITVPVAPITNPACYSYHIVN